MSIVAVRVPFQKIGNALSEREGVAGQEPARAVAGRVVARPVLQVAVVRPTCEREKVQSRVALLVAQIRERGREAPGSIEALVEVALGARPGRIVSDRAAIDVGLNVNAPPAKD